MADLGGYRTRSSGRYVRAAIGDLVTLRATWWEGPAPVAGDVVRTTTGRTYLITTVRMRGGGGPNGSFRGTLIARLVPSSIALRAGARSFDWIWNRRTKRRAPHGEAQRR